MSVSDEELSNCISHIFGEQEKFEERLKEVKALYECRFGYDIDEEAVEKDVLQQLKELARRQSRVQRAARDLATGRNR